MADLLVTALAAAPSLQTELAAPGVLLNQLPGMQGPSGPPGSDATGAAAATLNGHRVVAWTADGLLVHANVTDPDHVFAVAGLIESAAAPGDTVRVRSAGVVDHAGWAWSPGPVWFDAAGQPTQTPPPAGFARVIGRGAGTRLALDLQPPIGVL